MRVLLAAVLALAAAPVSAETFAHQRTVTPPSIAEPTVVGIELPQALKEEGGFRIVTQTGFAIPFDTAAVARDLMPFATILSAPAPADTVPRTNVEMIRGPGAFQPATADTLTFRFSFPADVTPSQLKFDMADGRIGEIRVRGGKSTADLHTLFAGFAVGGTDAQLSGERVRVVEVSIDVAGVVKIDGIRLLDSPDFLFFRAVPGKSYRLLSGGVDVAPVVFRGYPPMWGAHDPAVLATLGAASAAAGSDDNDGVEPPFDNCPGTWNRGQEDGDKDGLGDACDPCPTVHNGEDADGNGRCDALEDPDGDGIANIRDNCPTVSNRLQEDEDADGVGNLCDDVDDRFSANKPWLLWVGIAGIIVVLAGVAALALRPKA